MNDTPNSRASAHDLDLVALAAAGDRRAFGELVRRHGSAVRGLLRRMGADHSLSDDIAQDAFLAAFEQIAEFRGEGAFQGWVKRIAARLYVKRWRRDSRVDVMAEPPEQDADLVTDVSGAADRIDLDPVQARKVEHHAAVADVVLRPAVAARADGMDVDLGAPELVALGVTAVRGEPPVPHAGPDTGHRGQDGHPRAAVRADAVASLHRRIAVGQQLGGPLVGSAPRQ